MVVEAVIVQNDLEFSSVVACSASLYPQHHHRSPLMLQVDLLCGMVVTRAEESSAGIRVEKQDYFSKSGKADWTGCYSLTTPSDLASFYMQL